MTAAWSKGKYKTYPYYKCQTKGCSEYGKSLARAKVEGQFEEILKQYTPSQNFVQLIKEVVIHLLDQRLAQLKAVGASLSAEITKMEKSIDELLNRIVETQNASVISAYENKISQLERDKYVSLEKLDKNGQQKLTKKEFIELPLLFLSNPWKLWASGNITFQKMVLRLMFSERMEYTRDQGYRTPKTTIPFNVLRQIQSGNCEMVLLGRKTFNS